MRSLILLSVVGAVCVIAGAAAWSCLVSRAPLGTAGSASVRVEPPTLDFGAIPPGGAATRVLVVTNAGAGDLHVLRVETTCNCARVDDEFTVLAPGARLELPVTLRPRGGLGIARAWLTIHTDDPANPAVRVRAVAEVAHDERHVWPPAVFPPRIVVPRGWRDPFETAMLVHNRNVHAAAAVIDVPDGVDLTERNLLIDGGATRSLTLRIHPSRITTARSIDVRLTTSAGSAEGKCRVLQELPAPAAIGEASAYWIAGARDEAGVPMLDLGDVSAGNVRQFEVYGLDGEPAGVSSIQEVGANDSLRASPVLPANGASVASSIAMVALPAPTAVGIVEGRWALRTAEGRSLAFGARATVRPRGSDDGRGDALRVSLLGGESGRIAPCNCESGQSGGFARVATALGALSEDPGAHLVVHCGDGIGPQGVATDAKLALLFDLLRSVNCCVAVPGEEELAAGVSRVRAAATRAGVEMIGANVLVGGVPAFAATTEVTRSGVRLTLVGLVDSRYLASPELAGANVDIEDEETALRRVLEDLPAGAPVFVVGHLGRSTIERLTARFPRVSAFIVGHAGAVPDRIGATAILRGGRPGCELATYDVRISGSWITEANAHEPDLAGDRVRESATQVERISVYKQGLRNLVLSPPSGAAYAGSGSCARCHEAAFQRWSASAHAHAVETLARTGDEWDPDCLSCHTVSFDAANGYRSREATPGMSAVGCEACHGPGAAHVASRAPMGPARPCTDCHTPQTSNRFERDVYWSKIAHDK